MHRPRRSERVAVALGLAAALGFGCNPPHDPLTFDSQAQKLWRKYDPEAARRSAAEGRRSLAAFADYKPPPAETVETKKPEPESKSECEGADELKDEIDKLRSKIAELRAKSDDEKEAEKEKKKPEEAKEGEKPKAEHASSEAKKKAHDLDELLTDVHKLEHDLSSAEEAEHEKPKKKRHASEKPTKEAARDLCEKLGYVDESKTKKSDETEALARAVDRLDDIEHRLEKLEPAAKSEEPPEASSETESTPKLEELSSQLDELERRADALEGKSKPSAMGRRARRGETAPATLEVEGHVEAASGDQLVVRSDDGELLVLSVSGDTTIHEESERLTPDEIPDDAKVDVRAERRSGRLEAKDVRVEKPEK